MTFRRGHYELWYLHHCKHTGTAAKCLRNPVKSPSLTRTLLKASAATLWCRLLIKSHSLLCQSSLLFFCPVTCCLFLLFLRKCCFPNQTLAVVYSCVYNFIRLDDKKYRFVCKSRTDLNSYGLKEFTTRSGFFFFSLMHVSVAWKRKGCECLL